MQIRYLSYGLFKTGGYRHEKCLYEACLQHFTKQTDCRGELLRKNKLFGSPRGYLELLLWAFFKSGADINIVTARTALSALLRNWWNKKQVWIVLHNYDENDGKNRRMETYYKMLFSILRKKKTPRFKVIAVAPYWEKVFRDQLQLPHVFHFPNLFDLEKYSAWTGTEKNAWVHLGQYSSKNDPALPALAARLSTQGYYCYFSTLNPAEAQANNGHFEVIYFLNFNAYLDQVARSCCTLALSRVNEGWNRMAHESILLGTPVIGYDKGGLGDLLKASNSVLVKDTEEAYTCIVNSLWVLPTASFREAYQLSRAEHYIKPLCQP